MKMGVLSGLKPEKVFYYFEELCKIFKNAEAVEVVVHHSAHEEFCREIVSSAFAAMFNLACFPVACDFAHYCFAE